MEHGSHKAPTLESRRRSANKEMVVMAKNERTLSSQSALGGAEGILVADKSSHERDDGTPMQDQIRMRAYELYLERGTQPDDALEDWLQAERESRRSPDERIGTQDLAAQ
jgi:hypothetical protein